MLYTFDECGRIRISRKLAEASVKDLLTSIMNVNKIFGNNPASTRIYFPLARITRIKSLCVYLHRWVMINKTPDIRLIVTSKIQEIILRLDSWTVGTDNTAVIVKQKKSSLNLLNLKYLEMVLQLSFAKQTDVVGLPWSMLFVLQPPMWYQKLKSFLIVPITMISLHLKLH